MSQSVPTCADDPLDRGYLERNYLALDCADVLADVVAMYLESSVEKLAGLHDALTTAQLADLARLAHGLKGESGSVGAHYVSECAAALEQSARQGDLEGCRRTLPLLKHELERVIAVLRQEFNL